MMNIIKIQVSVFNADLEAAAEKLSLPMKPAELSWVDFFNSNSELVCSKGNYWCEYHNVSMRVCSVEFTDAVRDGDIIENSVCVTAEVQSVIPSELAAAVGVSGPLLSVVQFIPVNFSLGAVSGIINMNRGMISREGRRILAGKGITAGDISVNIIREKAAALIK